MYYSSTDFDDWTYPFPNSFKFQGWAPYEDASAITIPADILRITQDPITETNGSSWTRSWFVERTFASGSVRQQVFNGSCFFSINGDFDTPKSSYSQKFDYDYTSSRREYGEGDLYFEYDAFTSSPTDRNLSARVQEVVETQDNMKKTQGDMQEQLTDVQEAVDGLLELFRKEYP